MTTMTEQGRVPADTLPHRLLLVRNEMGWSQREAAFATGITYGEWQSMENGNKARGLDEKVQRIAATTGYDRNWIMWGGPLGTTPPDDTPKVQRPRTGSNRRPTAYNSPQPPLRPLVAVA